MGLTLRQFNGDPASPEPPPTLSSIIGTGAHRFDAAYLHVPFCFHKCHYCDFYSVVDADDQQESFIERLVGEVELQARHVSGPLDSVFMGGGTPTLLRPELLSRLLEAISTHLPLSDGCEWTVEANPETVTPEIAEVLAAGGVNRASIGCQSFSPRLLRALERRHDPASVPRAVESLRRAGIGSCSLDLIMGIPGSSMADWRSDLEQAIALEPDHLSCYGLQYEPNTPLAAKLAGGRVEAVALEVSAGMYEWTCERLRTAGWEQYEISNWARPGRCCRHNLVYWTGGSWLAMGPSAAGHLDGVRWRNVPRHASWQAGDGWPLLEDLERLDDSTRHGEQLMLELRLNRGIELDRLDCMVQGDGCEQRRVAIETGRRDGLLELESGRLRLTARGRLLADSLLCQLV
ncbi:MAG: radical SAM family heme chaperone HemW [Planctomycetota bacterium]|nr:radical SAM family heme chaperone HemW [Planctomycetota bacterium]